MLLIIRKALYILFSEFDHSIRYLRYTKRCEFLCEDYWWNSLLFILLISSFCLGLIRHKRLYSRNFFIIVVSCTICLIGIIWRLLAKLMLRSYYVLANTLIRIDTAIDFFFFVIILQFLISGLTLVLAVRLIILLISWRQYFYLFFIFFNLLAVVLCAISLFLYLNRGYGYLGCCFLYNLSSPLMLLCLYFWLFPYILLLELSHRR